MKQVATLVFIFFSFPAAILAQQGRGDSCVEWVGNRPILTPDTDEKLNEMMVEFICQADITQCGELRQILRSEPTPEALMPVEAELILTEEASGENPVSQAVKKTTDFIADTGSRLTFATGSAVTNMASDVGETVRENLTKRIRIRGQAFDRIRQKASSLIRKRLIEERFSSAIKKTSGALFGITSVTGLVATMVSYTALAYFRPDDHAVYIGNCLNLRSLESQTSVNPQSTRVPFEQFYTKGRDPVGEC
ncbi:MAG: hypothetical protein AAF203_11115, partial [Pseudomonadota bacterium]